MWTGNFYIILAKELVVVKSTIDKNGYVCSFMVQNVNVSFINSISVTRVRAVKCGFCTRLIERCCLNNCSRNCFLYSSYSCFSRPTYSVCFPMLSSSTESELKPHNQTSLNCCRRNNGFSDRAFAVISARYFLIGRWKPMEWNSPRSI